MAFERVLMTKAPSDSVFSPGEGRFTAALAWFHGVFLLKVM